jgi:hypothetical protein
VDVRQISAPAIEKAKFATPLPDIVTSEDGSVAVEMLSLATESYNPNFVTGIGNIFGSDTEPLAYQASTSPEETIAAQLAGWHPVSAVELGIAPADYGLQNGLQYSFSNGVYQAIDPNDQFAGSASEADAMVLTGLVDGPGNSGTSQDTQTINVKVADGLFEYSDKGVADTFVFKPHFGLEVVNGFDFSHDVLELDHSLFKGATTGESGKAALKLIADHSLQLGHDLLIFTDTHDVIDVRGANIHNLTSHDFIIT